MIMVGEIRDLETAEIAIKAAQTGHLVLSTLHTNDAPQTITRLMDMGVAPFTIASSVTLVIAQRLARRLHDCKQPQVPARAALLEEGFTARRNRTPASRSTRPVGCPDCTEGYKGRTGIYQVMPMTEEIQAHHPGRRQRAWRSPTQAAARRRVGPAPVGADEGQERHHQPRRNQPRHQGLTHGRDPSRRQDSDRPPRRRASQIFVWEGKDKRGIKIKGEQPRQERRASCAPTCAARASRRPWSSPSPSRCSAAAASDHAEGHRGVQPPARDDDDSGRADGAVVRDHRRRPEEPDDAETDASTSRPTSRAARRCHEALGKHPL